LWMTSVPLRIWVAAIIMGLTLKDGEI